MNLETANLQTVNSSKPQLLHSPYEQSIAASDDYYSFSDYASDASSPKSRLTALRYATPPSQIRSPNTSKDRLDSEKTLPAGKAKSRADGTEPLGVKFDENVVDNEGGKPMSAIPGDQSPPTPGVDDTPYIRFAIDQLTRDEELLGARPSVVEPEYPVERIIPDEGLNYYTPGTGGEPPRERQEDVQPYVPPESPTGLAQHNRSEIFIPVDPENTFRNPALNFVPLVLRPIFLLLIITLVLLMIGGLLFCTIYSKRHGGLWGYETAGGSRYFVFEFLPQILGVIIILWLFVIQSALYRIIPFCIMASEWPLDGVMQNLPIYPSNFLLPDTSHFKHGDRLMGVCLVIFWVVNFFTIPLLSCLFQTRIESQKWMWVTNLDVGYTLVALYAILLGSLLILLMRFFRPWTGLLWDPVSIADLLPLFQRSNILDSFSQTEITITPQTQIPRRTLRLGYWTTSHSNQTFYAVGEANAPIRLFSAPARKIEGKLIHDPKTFDVEYHTTNRDSNFTRNIHSPFVRYRWTPGYLRDTFVILFIIAALVLFLAFTIVSYVNHAVENGFDPLVSTQADPAGFSPSNFLYSILPSLLGNILFLSYQPIALFFATLQPFADLSSASGTLAEQSLLLAYPSLPPPVLTITALLNKHYKLAAISLISLLSAAIPILAGGTFTAQFFPSSQRILIAAHLPSFYALTTILALYTFSFLLIFPTRKRYLPHPIRTLADYISFVYASPLLRDHAFSKPASKADLVARLLTDPPGEKGRPRYAFGVFVGRDGVEHLGVDRLRRPGSMMVVAEGGDSRRQMSFRR